MENKEHKQHKNNIPQYEQEGIAMTCRSYEEYLRMFAIDQEDLGKGPLLDVAAGASSFVAEASKRGIEAIAADPLYALDPEQIASKGFVEIEQSTEKIARLQEHFDWTYYGNVERHRSQRIESLKRFVADFSEHRARRYVAAHLPVLPFAADHFRLVCCSHFLFLYGDQFDQNFHLQAIWEMLRVCRDDGRVLIYPLGTLKWERYSGLSEIIEILLEEGVTVNYLPTRLPFIPGSTQLLALRKTVTV